MERIQLALFSEQSKKAIALLKGPQSPGIAKNKHVFKIEAELSDDQAQNLRSRLSKACQKHDATLSLEDDKSVKTMLPWKYSRFICVDVETTGLSPEKDRVIELAWVIFEGEKEVLAKTFLCKVDSPLPPIITKLTGITDQMLVDEKPIEEHLAEFLEDLSSADFVVAYNAHFDRGFMENELKRVQMALPKMDWVDPLVYVKEIDKYKRGKKLTDATLRWGIAIPNAHRALDDTRATGQLLLKLASQIPATMLEDLMPLQNKWKAEQDASYKAYRARKSFDS